MDIMSEIEELQASLNAENIRCDIPCGNEPIIDLLGGLHARAAINKTKGKYPNVEKELKTLKELISLLKE